MFGRWCMLYKDSEAGGRGGGHVGSTPRPWCNWWLEIELPGKGLPALGAALEGRRGHCGREQVGREGVKPES